MNKISYYRLFTLIALAQVSSSVAGNFFWDQGVNAVHGLGKVCQWGWNLIPSIRCPKKRKLPLLENSEKSGSNSGSMRDISPRRETNNENLNESPRSREIFYPDYRNKLRDRDDNGKAKCKDVYSFKIR